MFDALVQQHLNTKEWEDWRAALVASTIVNCTPRKDQKTYQPSDLMPKRERKKQTVKQQIDQAKVITQVFGGEVDG